MSLLKKIVKKETFKSVNGHSIVISVVSKGRQSIALKAAYLLDPIKYDELFLNKKEEASHREATVSNADTTPTTSKNVPSTTSSSKKSLSQDKSGVNDKVLVYLTMML